MRIPYLIARFLTGALFVFSGIVKLNDPSGFGIKLNEYFDVFAQDLATSQDSMRLVVFSQGKKIIDQKTVLYSFDTEKEMVLEAQGVVDGGDGTAGIQKINVRCSWGGSSVAETTLDVLLPMPKSYDFEFVALTPGQELPPDGKLSALKNVGHLSFPAPMVGMPDGDIKVLIQTIPSGDSSNAEPLKWEDISVSESAAVNVAAFAKPNGSLFDFFKWSKDYSLYLSVFFCALEVLLGLAMLIGWNMRLTIAITAVLILFFTFLTGYSAYFNKVTDCGCFGDFLKLKPWHSFYKDLVLSGLILIMIAGVKLNIPWFSKPFGVKLMGVLSVLTLAFGVYCYMYLPVWDFLPYKIGNNIKTVMTFVPEGERSSDSIEITWVLYKSNKQGGTDSITCTTAEFEAKMGEGYQFDAAKSQRKKLVIEGYKSPIHDFAINNNQTGADMKDSFLNAEGYQLVYVAPYIDQAYTGGMDDLRALFTWGNAHGVRIYPLTASSDQPAGEFAKANKLPVTFYSADQKMLMTMARYNPTVFFLKGAEILGKWSGRDLPEVEDIEELMQAAEKLKDQK
ncbi:MAG: hypothetical protein RL525_1527 [Bacteroidota bacterium]|jgi:uncharacterized membrane protein YphA (DoxX/SURF4 family)